MRLEQKFLINGANGGVETFALQIDKSFGAEIIAVCSTRNAELAHTIGAEYIIDYTQEDFKKWAAVQSDYCYKRIPSDFRLQPCIEPQWYLCDDRRSR